MVPLAFVGMLLAVKLVRASGPEQGRGLRLLPVPRLNAQLNGGRLRRVAAAVRLLVFAEGQQPLPLKIGSVVIPAKKESENFLITGSPGAGKSTLIRPFLRRIA